MYLCYDLMSCKELAEQDLELGPGSSELIASLERSDFLSRTLQINLFEEVYVARWCIVHGIKYCKNILVITGTSDDSMPIFEQIAYIIVTDETSIKPITEEWHTVKYDRHTHSYAIQQLSADCCSSSGLVRTYNLQNAQNIVCS